MRKYFKQRGDTIVEVLLAMAVIGMVLGVAYGIANRSVAIGRSAQERSEALKFAESQLELIKVYIAEQDLSSDTPTEVLATALDLTGDASTVDGACFVEDGADVEVAKIDQSLETQNDDCEKGGLYQVYVACVSSTLNTTSDPIDRTNTCSPPAPGTQDNRKIAVRVIWERLGGGFQQNGEPVRDSVDLYYRFGG